MKRILFALTRTRLGGILLGWIVAHFSSIFPVHKLVETDNLLAFQHPAPSYPFHILILPKGSYRSLTDLPSRGSRFETDLFRTVKELVEHYQLEEWGYRLIANGGPSQQVGVLHFHLISDNYRRSTP